MENLDSIIKPGCDATFTLTVPRYAEDMKDFGRSLPKESHFSIVYDYGTLEKVDDSCASLVQTILEVLEEAFKSVVDSASEKDGSLGDFLLQLWIHYMDLRKPLETSSPFWFPSLWNLQLPNEGKLYVDLWKHIDEALKANPGASAKRAWYREEKLQFQVVRTLEQLTLQLVCKVKYTLPYYTDTERTFLAGLIMQKSDGEGVVRLRQGSRLLTSTHLSRRSHRLNTCTVTNYSSSINDLNSSLFSYCHPGFGDNPPPSYSETEPGSTLANKGGKDV